MGIIRRAQSALFIPQLRFTWFFDLNHYESIYSGGDDTFRLFKLDDDKINENQICIFNFHKHEHLTI